EYLRTVDLDVDQRVEEAEAVNPRRDGTAECPRLPRQVAAARNPRPHRREAIARAQPEVRQPGDPLQVRVDDEACDRDRPQPTADRVALPDGHEEHRERRETEP